MRITGKANEVKREESVATGVGDWSRGDWMTLNVRVIPAGSGSFLTLFRFVCVYALQPVSEGDQSRFPCSADGLEL